MVKRPDWQLRCWSKRLDPRTRWQKFLCFINPKLIPQYFPGASTYTVGKRQVTNGTTITTLTNDTTGEVLVPYYERCPGNNWQWYHATAWRVLKRGKRAGQETHEGE